MNEVNREGSGKRIAWLPYYCMIVNEEAVAKDRLPKGLDETGDGVEWTGHYGVLLPGSNTVLPCLYVCIV